MLRRCLLHTAQSDFLSAGLLRAATTLLAEPGLRKLAACTPKALGEEWVTLSSSEPGPSVCLYSEWKDMSDLDRNRFIHTLRSDTKLRAALSGIAPFLKIRRDMQALAFIGNCLESIFPLSCEPLLISIANATSTVGLPTQVDLDLSRRWISRSHGRQPSLASEYPVYINELRKITVAVREGRLETFRFQITDDAWKAAAPKEIEALKILERYTLPRATRGEKFIRKRSRIRYLQAIPSVLEKLFDPDADIIFPEQYGACQIIREFGSKPAAITELLKRVSVTQTTAEVNLVGFDAARRLYGLSGSFPSPCDRANAALRVLAILLFCGRRVRCLTEVKVSDFAFGENGLEAFLPSSKVNSQRESWLYLSPILGDTDLSFLTAWIERMKREELNEAYITDFYQILDFATDPDPKVFRSMKERARRYAQALKPALLKALAQYPTTIVATHVPPYEGAAWHEGLPSSPKRRRWFATARQSPRVRCATVRFKPRFCQEWREHYEMFDAGAFEGTLGTMPLPGNRAKLADHPSESSRSTSCGGSSRMRRQICCPCLRSELLRDCGRVPVALCWKI